ncbi:2744_t:CDS:2, partial [Dentiscutata heterogama]
PYFSVSGAMLADIAIIDLPTPVFLLIWQKHDEMMLLISRTFHALKKYLQILYQNYNQLLAEAGYSPKVLASLIIPRNWLIVYMDAEHVYKDLCEGNILVCQLKNNDFDVKLINFEWSGEVGSTHYSHFMNNADIE